jgi:cytochrome b561
VSTRTTTDRQQFTGSMRFLHWLMAAMVLAIVEFSSHPIRNWNRSNLASLRTRSTMTQCSSRCWR